MRPSEPDDRLDLVWKRLEHGCFAADGAAQAEAARWLPVAEHLHGILANRVTPLVRGVNGDGADPGDERFPSRTWALTTTGSWLRHRCAPSAPIEGGCRPLKSGLSGTSNATICRQITQKSLLRGRLRIPVAVLRIPRIYGGFRVLRRVRNSRIPRPAWSRVVAHLCLGAVAGSSDTSSSVASGGPSSSTKNPQPVVASNGPHERHQVTTPSTAQTSPARRSTARRAGHRIP